MCRPRVAFGAVNTAGGECGGVCTAELSDTRARGAITILRGFLVLPIYKTRWSSGRRWPPVGTPYQNKGGAASPPPAVMGALFH